MFYKCFIFSLLHLLLRKQCCSAEEGPPTDEQIQLPVDTVRALILCIVPSRTSKSFVRLQMAFCYQLNRPAAVSCIGQPTLSITFEENEGMFFFMNLKYIGFINPQVNT